jgi:hypothetical protein
MKKNDISPENTKNRAPNLAQNPIAKRKYFSFVRREQFLKIAKKCEVAKIFRNRANSQCDFGALLKKTNMGV